MLASSKIGGANHAKNQTHRRLYCVHDADRIARSIVTTLSVFDESVMNTLSLIYVNADFRTLIGFDIETSLSYDMAFEQYSLTEYIPALLKEARSVIHAFGGSIKLPNQFATHMNDAELDYLLLLLHTNVDALIDGHIYVRLPAKHAESLMGIDKPEQLWRSNGIGLNELLLARRDEEHRVFICVPTFEEVGEAFVTVDPERA